jgi:hypothetical protein
VISKLNSGAGWRGQETAPRLPIAAMSAMSVRQLPERFLESRKTSKLGCLLEDGRPRQKQSLVGVLGIVTNHFSLITNHVSRRSRRSTGSGNSTQAENFKLVPNVSLVN